MTAAAIYVRVSTQEQSQEGVSPEAQEARSRAYCTLNGFSDPRVFYDGGVSGSIPLSERPHGKELVAAIAAGELQHVVTMKLDRLFRDALDALEVTRDWDAAGVAMHLVDMGGTSLSTSSAMGKLFLTITAALAECERNLGRERTKTALAHKKQRGDRLGTTPLGFTTPAPGAPLQPDAKELASVRLIVALRRRDAHRWSFREIAARLEREGHATKRGGAWRAQTVKRIWDRRASYASVL